MQVLLTDTYTCAVVNGFQSSFYRCSAGVRQGCPLAPLMYLFAGQALLCHLRQCGIGIDVAAGRLVASQYADDVEPLLRSGAAVPAVGVACIWEGNVHCTALHCGLPMGWAIALLTT